MRQGRLRHTKRPWTWRFYGWTAFDHENGKMQIVTGGPRPRWLFKRRYVVMLVDHVAKRNVMIPSSWIEHDAAVARLLSMDDPIEIVQMLRTIDPATGEAYQ